jgi:hypothetical protein
VLQNRIREFTLQIHEARTHAARTKDRVGHRPSAPVSAALPFQSSQTTPYPPPTIADRGVTGSVRAGGLPGLVALRFALDIAQGMRHIHGHRIVHGDLKPGGWVRTVPCRSHGASGSQQSVTSTAAFPGLRCNQAVVRQRSQAFCLRVSLVPDRFRDEYRTGDPPASRAESQVMCNRPAALGIQGVHLAGAAAVGPGYSQRAIWLLTPQQPRCTSSKPCRCMIPTYGRRPNCLLWPAPQFHFLSLFTIHRLQLQ